MSDNTYNGYTVPIICLCVHSDGDDTIYRAFENEVDAKRYIENIPLAWYIKTSLYPDYATYGASQGSW